MLTSHKKFHGGTALKSPARTVAPACLIWLSLLGLHQMVAPSFVAAQTTENSNKMLLTQPGEEGAASLVLSPGDLLDVEVFNTPELSGKLRVSHEGTISMPVAGDIKVSGMTPMQADAAIEQRLRDGQIVLSPSVTVLVTDYATQGVDVVGEVKNPGIYRFLGTHSLYDALAAAGGAAPTQGATITVTHREDALHPVVIQVHSPDYSAMQHATEVRPGDVVDVSRAESIYVVGDVTHSGQFPITFGKPLNALDALALAQGPNKTAKLTKASIVRKTANGGVEAIPVDLRAVQKNKELDPVLQAEDILVVPRSGARAFIDTALPGATGALVGAIAYGFIR